MKRALDVLRGRAEVAKLQAPEVTYTDKDVNLREYNCGGVTIWNVARADHHMGINAAVGQWRLRQQSERGITSAHHTAENWIRREREKLAKMERGVA